METAPRNEEVIEDEEQLNPPPLDEVKQAITRLANNKSPRTDNLPTELLKFGGEMLQLCIHALIKEIWRQKFILEEWNIGIICPIHKKGDSLQWENYRDITLLNAAYKILATIIHKRITPYAENIIEISMRFPCWKINN